jgi:cytochrome c-type biogenesis protein CcmH/NrfG
MTSVLDMLADARRHHAAGRLGQAESVYRCAIAADPACHEALCVLGALLQQRGALDEAEQCFARALAIKAAPAAAYFARGNILVALAREAEAIECFEHALHLDPSHVGTCLQLGHLVFPHDTDTGLRYFERAHAADPAHAGARACLALGHLAAGAFRAGRQEWPAMFTAYHRALEIDPEHAGGHFNLAVEYLRQGMFPEGWWEYEWRWRWDKFADRPRGFSQPQWRGEPLEGACILLHAEQGFGDAIQFARYAPLVAARGGTVILEVDRRLVRLMDTLPGVTTLVARGEALPAFDWQCPLMSLPLACGTTLATIPHTVPYLTPRHESPDVFGAAAAGVTRVGLVWAGSPAHLRDQRRSIDIDLFAPLTRLPGLQWYSLQKGSPALTLVTPQPGLHLVDLAPAIHDFADTAALVASLDLVITVDTSVAHLVGALGKPVWILVPNPADWRWLLDREDSPWYPTARLFRQRTPGQWAPVVDQVREALGRDVVR